MIGTITQLKSHRVPFCQQPAAVVSLQFSQLRLPTVLKTKISGGSGGNLSVWVLDHGEIRNMTWLRLNLCKILHPSVHITSFLKRTSFVRNMKPLYIKIFNELLVDMAFPCISLNFPKSSSKLAAGKISPALKTTLCNFESLQHQQSWGLWRNNPGFEIAFNRTTPKHLFQTPQKIAPPPWSHPTSLHGLHQVLRKKNLWAPQRKITGSPIPSSQG